MGERRRAARLSTRLATRSRRLVRRAQANNAAVPRTRGDEALRLRGAAEGVAGEGRRPGPRARTGAPAGVRRAHAAARDADTTQEQLRPRPAASSRRSARPTSAALGRGAAEERRRGRRDARALRLPTRRRRATARVAAAPRPGREAARRQVRRRRREGAARGLPRRARERRRRRARAHLAAHARQVRDHIRSSRRSVLAPVRPVAGLRGHVRPDEAFLRAAHEQDGSLDEDALAARRHPRVTDDADRAAAHRRRDAGSRRRSPQSAREVHELGRELYDRLATFAGHFVGVGAASTAPSGATTRRSARSRRACSSPARKLAEHGVDDELKLPEHVERDRRAEPRAGGRARRAPREQLRAIDAA